MDALRGVARVDSLAGGTILNCELAEAGEAHLLAVPQRIRDRVEERIDCFGGIAAAEPALCGDTLDELSRMVEPFSLEELVLALEDRRDGLVGEHVHDRLGQQA